MRRALSFLLIGGVGFIGCQAVSLEGDPHLPGGSIPLPNQSGIAMQSPLPRAPIQLDGQLLLPGGPVQPGGGDTGGTGGGTGGDTGGGDTGGGGTLNAPRFVDLQASWEAAGCSSAGQCHDQDERTIVVKVNPDAARLLENWSQIAPPEAGGVGVNATGSVNHFSGRPDAALWQSWQAAGYPYVE